MFLVCDTQMVSWSNVLILNQVILGVKLAPYTAEGITVYSLHIMSLFFKDVIKVRNSK